MYNVIELQKAFAGLVGFYQPEDPQYPQIYTDLTTSTSGKYVQRAHSLCTIENLYNVGPEFKSFVYKQFSDQEQGLKLGEKRKYNSKIYEVISVPLLAGNPEASEQWKEIDPFSEWITKIYKNACSNLVSNLLAYKKVKNAGKSLLDSQVLYSGFGMIANKIIKHDRFVGVEIITSRNQNVGINIARLGFQVDTAQTVNFYIYHSSQVEPIKVIPVVIDKASTFFWLDLKDVVLSYMNGNNASGRFFLGYYESTLQGQAIQKEMNFNSPCGNCSNYDLNAYNAWSKYTGINSFYVESDFINDNKTIFDVSKVKYVTNNNFGINLSISAYCDLTKFFITNKSLFADALSMQIALDILNEIAFTSRINGISAQNLNIARAELNPAAESKSFMSQYTEYLKALDYDFSGFDSNCLPCAQRGGIIYGAI